MQKPKNHRSNIGLLIAILVFAFIDLALLIRYLVGDKNIAILQPKGQIGQQQYELFLIVTVVLLVIAIPSLLLFYFVAWRYRESSPKSVEKPKASRSKTLVASIWIIPTLFTLIIVGVIVPSSYRLAPQKPIESDAETLRIQVIAMRWKWLFIYPEEGIASVNYVQIPVDRPVEFEMTADESPMSSFWIPNLGGQLYVMTSHVNRLNLIAEETGDYTGSTPELTGAGFAKMRFTARASTETEFSQWVYSTKSSGEKLTSDMYKDLLLPSEANPVQTYSSYDNDIYDNVIVKYAGMSEGHSHNSEDSEEGDSH